MKLIYHDMIFLVFLLLLKNVILGRCECHLADVVSTAEDYLRLNLEGYYFIYFLKLYRQSPQILSSS
jgi:hypothetical protein